MGQVYWGKCTGGAWCGFNSLNVDEFFDGKYGVYIIWRNIGNPQAIYVGQGNIGERIIAHRNSEAIQSWGWSSLYVTWAVVPHGEGLRIEAYLWNRLKPRVGHGQTHPNPITVNLPWNY